MALKYKWTRVRGKYPEIWAEGPSRSYTILLKPLVPTPAQLLKWQKEGEAWLSRKRTLSSMAEIEG